MAYKVNDYLESDSRLRRQTAIYCNSRVTVTKRGRAYTSHAFKEYCDEEVLIIAGFLRSNGQVERINEIIIPVLTKLSISNPVD